MTNPFSADSNPFIFAKTKRKTHGQTVRTMTYIDDWGRPWIGQSDKNTGHPVGSISPLGWRVPHKDLIPPPKHHKFAPEDQWNNRLHIDLQGWITDHEHALQAWHDNRDQIAQKNPTAAALAATGDTSALDALAGPRPLDLKFLNAMAPRDRNMRLVRDNPQPSDYARANKWVLGILDPNGQPYPQPAWATPDVMATLQRKEAYSAATLQDDGSEFANPDEDAYIADDDAAAIVERLDGQEQYAGFDDEPPKPEKRSHHKKVNP